MNFLTRGSVIGFCIAAPVGPIGVLCIRRTLAGGRIAGFISGIGAATADAIYGCIAAFGLTAVSQVLVEQQKWFRLIGGAFLCYLGAKTFFTKPADRPAAARANNLLDDYTSTLFLTLTNPATIISFAAIFAGLGLANEKRNISSSILLVFGVLFGSALWWLLLSWGVGLLQRKFDPDKMKWVNIFSGVILTGFGLAALFVIR